MKGITQSNKIFPLLLLLALLAGCNRVKQEEVKEETEEVILRSEQFSATDSPDFSTSGRLISDFPTAIRIYYGTWINGIGIAYGNDYLFVGNNSGSEKEYKLQEGEYITGVSGAYVLGGNTNTGKSTAFTELIFTITSNLQDTTRNVYLFDIQSEMNSSESIEKKTFEFNVQEGNAIFCLYGTNDPSIASIGFYEKKIPPVRIEEADPPRLILFAGTAAAVLILIILLTIFILKKKGYRF